MIAETNSKPCEDTWVGGEMEYDLKDDPGSMIGFNLECAVLRATMARLYFSPVVKCSLFAPINRFLYFFQRATFSALCKIGVSQFSLDTSMDQGGGWWGGWV